MTATAPERSHRTRWRQHRIDRRHALVQGASEVFAQVGYDQAHMNMLAGATGVAKATVYSYFRNKAVLFQAVIEHWLEALPEPELLYTPGKTLRSQLNEVARELLRHAMHPASLAFNQMLARSTRVPPAYLGQWHQRYRMHQRYLEKVFSEHRYSNDPALAASQFMLLVLGSHEADISGATDEVSIAAAVELFVRSCASTNNISPS